MNQMDFCFEQNSWESYLMALPVGSGVAALNLLTMLEGEEDSAVEDAVELLNQRLLTLVVSQLPNEYGSGQSAVRLKREAQLAKRGLKPSDFEDTDPLRLYLEEVAMTPACGDERILSSKAANGDEAAMQELLNLGLSRVLQIACEYTGRGVLLLDLIQEGSLGLWQGICEYSGGNYTDCSERWIRNAMGKAILLQYLSNGIGQKLRAAMQDYKAVDERLLSELGRNPTIEEIALELHMTREEAELVRKSVQDVYLMNQAKPAEEEAPDEAEENLAVEDTAYFQMRQRIQDLLSVLDEKDAQLLSLRFGLDRGLPMSAEEAGRYLGLTPEEITAREVSALSRLRTEGLFS